MTTHSQCASCRGLFADQDGPTHRYMLSSPGCWAAFGVVLEREYSNPSLMDVHRLSVDAYAVQHPGVPGLQAQRSVALHLIRLQALLVDRADVARSGHVMSAASNIKDRFTWLQPPSSLGDVTVADVVAVSSPEAHRAMVQRWAHAAWAAWQDHHETIRHWSNAAMR